MNSLNRKHRTLIKIIAIAIVCLFTINNIAWAYPDMGRELRINAHHTLQIQSMFKPILDVTGRQFDTQVRLELACILAMALKEDMVPFQDINSELDKWLSVAPEVSRDRLLDVLSNPRKEDGKTRVDLQIFDGPNKGKKFRITSSCEDIAEIQKDESKIKIESISDDTKKGAGKAPAIVSKLKEILGGNLKGKKVLELGVGSNPDHILALSSEGAEVTAVDIDHEDISRLKGSLIKAGADEVKVVEMDFNQPFTLPSDQFDAIIFRNILDFVPSGIDALGHTREDIRKRAEAHFNAQKRFFGECVKVLKPGGMIVAEDVAEPEYELSDNEFQKLMAEFYEIADTGKAAIDAGFSIIERGRSFADLMLVLVSRKGEKNENVVTFTASQITGYSGTEYPYEGTYPVKFVNTLKEQVSEKSEPVVIVDLGCGEGQIARWMNDKGFSVLGLDINPNNIKKAKKKTIEMSGNLVGDASAWAAVKEMKQAKKPALAFEQSDLAHGIPLPDASVDALVMHRTLSQVINKHDREFILEEIARVLKPGGTVSYLDFRDSEPDGLDGRYPMQTEVIERLLRDGLLSTSLRTLIDDPDTQPHLVYKDKRGNTKNESEYSGADELYSDIKAGHVEVVFIGIHEKEESVQKKLEELGFAGFIPQEFFMKRKENRYARLGGFVAKKSSVVTESSRIGKKAIPSRVFGLNDRKYVSVSDAEDRNKVLKERMELNAAELGKAKEALRLFMARKPECRSVMELFLELLENSPPELYSFNPLVGDLFGFVSAGDNLIALQEELIDNPIALFHEIGEFLNRKYTISLSLVRDGKEVEIRTQDGRVVRVFLSTHVRNWLIAKDEKWSKTWGKDPHYLLRAVQLDLFGKGTFGRDQEDIELTRLIQQMQASSSHKDAISGPFSIGNKRYYAREVNDSAAMSSLLDRWFEQEEKPYFSRGMWDSAAKRAAGGSGPVCMIKLEDASGNILGLSVSTKGEFPFKEKNRKVWVGDYMEVSAKHRSEGIGEILIAKITERAMEELEQENTMVAPDGEAVYLEPEEEVSRNLYIVHPAEDEEYKDKQGGKSAKDFFRGIGFRSMPITWTAWTEDEWEKDLWMSLSEEKARELVEKVRSRMEDRPRGKPRQLTLFGDEEPDTSQIGRSLTDSSIDGSIDRSVDDDKELTTKIKLFSDKHYRLVVELLSSTFSGYNPVESESSLVDRFFENLKDVKGQLESETGEYEVFSESLDALVNMDDSAKVAIREILLGESQARSCFKPATDREEKNERVEEYLVRLREALIGWVIDELVRTERFLMSGEEMESLLSDMRLMFKSVQETATSRDPSMLAGRYRLEKLLGTGEYSMVYKAKDLKTGADVTVRVLRYSGAKDLRRKLPSFLKGYFVMRYLSEVGGVIKGLDMGRWERGNGREDFFMVTEFVPGESLDTVIDSGRQLNPDEAATLAKKVLEIIRKVQGKRIVHTDIKPANMLLPGKGGKFDFSSLVFLVDFDLALRFPESGELKINDVRGTPEYLPWEVFPLHEEGKYNKSTDVYGLGIILYKALTGKVPLPYDGRNIAEYFNNKSRVEPTDIRDMAKKEGKDIPDALAEFIMRCIRRDPNDRFASVDAAIKYLEEGVSPSLQIGNSARVEMVSPDNSKFRAIDSKGNRHVVGLIPRELMNMRDLGANLSAIAGNEFYYRDIIYPMLVRYAQTKAKEYTFRVLVEDLFAFTSSENDLLAFYSELKENPIAEFHEIGEYLIKKGIMELRMESGYVVISFDGEDQTSIVPSTDTMQFIMEEQRDEEGEKGWDEGWDENPHYLLRILQREMFPLADKDLSDYIRENKQEIQLPYPGQDTTKVMKPPKKSDSRRMPFAEEPAQGKSVKRARRSTSSRFAFEDAGPIREQRGPMDTNALEGLFRQGLVMRGDKLYFNETPSLKVDESGKIKMDPEGRWGHLVEVPMTLSDKAMEEIQGLFYQIAELKLRAEKAGEGKYRDHLLEEAEETRKEVNRVLRKRGIDYEKLTSTWTSADKVALAEARTARLIVEHNIKMLRERVKKVKSEQKTGVFKDGKLFGGVDFTVIVNQGGRIEIRRDEEGERVPILLDPETEKLRIVAKDPHKYVIKAVEQYNEKKGKKAEEGNSGSSGISRGPVGLLVFLIGLLTPGIIEAAETAVKASEAGKELSSWAAATLVMLLAVCLVGGVVIIIYEICGIVAGLAKRIYNAFRGKKRIEQVEKPLSVVDGSGLFGTNNEKWEEIVENRWHEGVDFKGLFADRNVLVIGDTHHGALGIQKGFVNYLEQLKAAGVTHLGLEIPSDLKVDNISEISESCWIPHRLEQLVTVAQRLGIKVVFIDMPAGERDPSWDDNEQSSQRGMYMGKYLAGQMEKALKEDPCAHMAVITGYAHIRDSSQIPKQLEDRGIPYGLVAAVCEGEHGSIFGIEHQAITLPVVRAIMDLVKGGKRYGFIDFRGLDVNVEGIDGIIHFPRPLPEAPEAKPLSAPPSEWKGEDGMARALAPLSKHPLAITSLNLPVAANFGERVEPSVHYWKGTNQDKALDFIVKLREQMGGEYGVDAGTDAALVYLASLLRAYVRNTGRHSMGGSIVYIGFVPEWKFFEFGSVDTFGYPYTPGGEYGSLFQHWEVSLKTLQERFGYEDLFENPDLLRTMKVMPNMDRPDALVKIVPFILTARKHPERIWSSSEFLHPTLKVFCGRGEKYYHWTYTGGRGDDGVVLSEVEAEDFHLDEVEKLFVECRDINREIHAHMENIVCSKGIQDIALRQIHIGHFLWNIGGGLLERVGRFIFKLRIRNWRAISLNKYLRKGLNEVDTVQRKAEEVILSARKKLRYINDEEIEKVLAGYDEAIEYLRESIKRTEKLFKSYPDLGEASFFDKGKAKDNLEQLKQKYQELVAKRKKMNLAKRDVPEAKVVQKALGLPAPIDAAPGSASLGSNIDGYSPFLHAPVLEELGKVGIPFLVKAILDWLNPAMPLLNSCIFAGLLVSVAGAFVLGHIMGTRGPPAVRELLNVLSIEHIKKKADKADLEADDAYEKVLNEVAECAGIQPDYITNVANIYDGEVELKSTTVSRTVQYNPWTILRYFLYRDGKFKKMLSESRPVVVKMGENYYIAEGYNICIAATLRGINSVPAKVIDITDRETSWRYSDLATAEAKADKSTTVVFGKMMFQRWSDKLASAMTDQSIFVKMQLHILTVPIIAAFTGIIIAFRYIDQPALALGLSMLAHLVINAIVWTIKQEGQRGYASLLADARINRRGVLQLAGAGVSAWVLDRAGIKAAQAAEKSGPMEITESNVRGMLFKYLEMNIQNKGDHKKIIALIDFLLHLRDISQKNKRPLVLKKSALKMLVGAEGTGIIPWEYVESVRITPDFATGKNRAQITVKCVFPKRKKKYTHKVEVEGKKESFVIPSDFRFFVGDYEGKKGIYFAKDKEYIEAPDSKAKYRSLMKGGALKNLPLKHILRDREGVVHAKASLIKIPFIGDITWSITKSPTPILLGKNWIEKHKAKERSFPKGFELPTQLAMATGSAVHTEGMKIRQDSPYYSPVSMMGGMQVNVRYLDQTEDLARTLIWMGKAEENWVTVGDRAIRVVTDRGTRLSGALVQIVLEKTVERYDGDVNELPNTIVIGMLDVSPYMFEDHRRNGFIGINKAVNEIEDEKTRSKLVLTGLFHELAHELTGRSGPEFEKEQLERDIDFCVELFGDNKEKVVALHDSMLPLIEQEVGFLARLQEVMDVRNIEGFTNRLNATFMDLWINLKEIGRVSPRCIKGMGEELALNLARIKDDVHFNLPRSRNQAIGKAGSLVGFISNDFEEGVRAAQREGGYDELIGRIDSVRGSINAVLDDLEKLRRERAFFSEEDRRHMTELIRFAKEKVNAGELDPNIPVAARLVDGDGNIVVTVARRRLESHSKYGVNAVHAEVEAIRQAEALDEPFTDWANATLYVNLAPCHNCTKAIAEFYGLRKVVYTVADENFPLTEQRGNEDTCELNKVEMVKCEDPSILQQMNEIFKTHKVDKRQIMLDIAEKMLVAERNLTPAYRKKHREYFGKDVQVCVFDADLWKENIHVEGAEAMIFRHIEYIKLDLNPKKDHVLLIVGSDENCEAARERIVDDGIYEEHNIVLVGDNADEIISQIGKRAKVIEVDKDKNVAIIEDSKGDAHEIYLMKQDKVFLRKLKAQLHAMERLDKRHKVPLKVLVALFEELPVDICIFDEAIEDLFGFASPEDKVIAVHKYLAEDPVALLHEIMEYMVSSGQVKVRYKGLFARFLNKLGILKFAERFFGWTGLVSGKVLLGEEKSGGVWEIQVKGEALSVALKDTDNPHYLIRAVQREVFGDLDRELTESIKTYYRANQEGILDKYPQARLEGYKMLGVDDHRYFADYLRECTGVGFLAQHENVYSPLQDNWLGLNFARAIPSEVKAVARRVKESGRDDMKILVIGAGTGIDAMTASYQARKNGIKNVHVDAIDIDRDAVDNIRQNLWLAGAEYEDAVYPKLVETGKEFDGLASSYDLILFEAPDVEKSEDFAKISERKMAHAIKMDEEVFKGIMKEVGKRLSPEGAALISNHYGIFHKADELFPSNLSVRAETVHRGALIGDDVFGRVIFYAKPLKKKAPSIFIRGLMGSRFREKLTELNGGKMPRVIAAGNTPEVVKMTLVDQLEGANRDEYVVCQIRMHCPEREVYRIVVDKPDNILTNLDILAKEDVVIINKFDFVFDFAVYPEEEAVFVHNVSVGSTSKSESYRKLMGKGVISEMFDNFAEVMKVNCPGWYISSYLLEDDGAVAHLMRKHFRMTEGGVMGRPKMMAMVNRMVMMAQDDESEKIVIGEILDPVKPVEEEDAASEDGAVEARRLVPEKEERRIEAAIRSSNMNSQNLIKGIKEYFHDAKINPKDQPVDVVVDLSLIPKEDIEENAETWSYLIRMCEKLGNVNFIFEIPKFTGRGDLPSELLGDIEKAAGKEKFAATLEKYLDKGLMARVNAGRRKNAIELPILSKRLLEWKRDSEIELEANQYPVALEGLTTVNDQEVVLRNFEAALSIGLSKAALAIAKKRDSEKTEDEEKELPIIRKKILDKMQKLYAVFREDVVLTEKTLDNMIHQASAVRMNLAISLALPPITRMFFQKLKDHHDKMQLFLLAA
ncbi:MAG: methyltransferase domain-containing protein [Candidatus Omnitrophota bacterium]